MKLKEIHEPFKNEKILDDWLASYSEVIFDSPMQSYVHVQNAINEKTLEINPEISTIILKSSKHVEFSFPLKLSENHGRFFNLNLTALEENSIVVPDLEDVPADTTELGFSLFCTVKSFNGIQKLKKLKALSFDGGRNNIECGLLGILKVPSLKEFWISGDNKNPTPLFKALRIVKSYALGSNKHLGIIDCQNELIDAGLEEYAKL